MSAPLTPEQAWQPLPATAWDSSAARHLLRRAGWAARPEDVARAVADGLTATLNRLFPATPPAFPRPVFMAKAEERLSALRPKKRAATTREERQILDREERELERLASVDFSMRWLQAAAEPARGAYEKWVLFLADVYVVAFEKVRRADYHYIHRDLLRTLGAGPAPELTKAISRSPAMIDYLDLSRNSRRAPNENFARELFELFVLGEGHYTEDDIKQAARAFAGYRIGKNGFRLDPRSSDSGTKTVFGQNGAWSGDEVIDLAYTQPSAATFLPREMARFYLTDTPPPPEFFTPLGATWRASGLELRALCHAFFGSTVFYHPDYRANYIKSPVHYLLGLVQDLRLDLTPLPRATLQPLRQMGQNLLEPPNVRGWVGGRLWINSSTLAARRQLARTLCTPLDEENLNADERLELTAARDSGRSRFTVDDERIRDLASLGANGVADRLCDFFLPLAVPPAYRATVVDYLETGTSEELEERVRRATIALLQSPEYQLC